MRKNKIFREWLKKADEDFGFACISLKETEYYPQICFHFQQAAEKYLSLDKIITDIQKFLECGSPYPSD